MKKIVYLSSITLFLMGCNTESTNDISVVDKVEVVEKDNEEVFLKELEQYKSQNDVVKFSETVQEVKAEGYIEKESIIKVIDSFVTKLIEENDVKLLEEYYPKIVNINAFVPDNKHYFRDFMREERVGKDEQIELLLDEMEIALKEKDFSKVETYYNESSLKDNDEASAMYNYSLYLQTDQNSYEASLPLALAVDHEYSGRFNEEIAAGVKNNSYVTKNTFPGPIDDYSWRNAERSAKIASDIVEKNQENKDEWERRKAEAVGQNPRIGMTTGQVEVSLWGKPNDINRTVTRYGTREQWVYGNRQYLYFTDGVLTSFQD